MPRTTDLRRCRAIVAGRGPIVGLIVAMAALPSAASTQAPEVFESTQSANLPTAAMIRGGLWMFEISHRFLPPISDGVDAFWGLDGPVNNRLGLAYAPSDRVMIGVLRSNFDGNVEFNLKGQLLSGSVGEWRYQIGAMGGIGFNFNALETADVENNESQFYGQAIANVRWRDVALGVVPTGFRNPRIEDSDPVNTFAVGLHGQYYAMRSLSVLAEWNMSVESVDYPYDAVSAGLEIRTRGHAFKLVLSNQVRMNPTQFLVGTPSDYGADQLRIGFNITRVLSF
ncbi:MAG: DUF5777 family beta-barrel protein [Gemmatimonadota bacterium]|nr:DUF5777 family beta-barrel protein [Gemmatimonadota bacterium]